MSYDIWLTIDTGGAEPALVWDNFNYTSNCGRMWRAAGADLAEFDGKLAGECSPILRAAIDALKADPATLLPALTHLADGFEAHPKATVVVSR